MVVFHSNILLNIALFPMKNLYAELNKAQVHHVNDVLEYYEGNKLKQVKMKIHILDNNCS